MALKKVVDKKWGKGTFDNSVKQRGQGVNLFDGIEKLDVTVNGDEAVVKGNTAEDVLHMSKVDGKWVWDVDAQMEKDKAVWGNPQTLKTMDMAKSMFKTMGEQFPKFTETINDYETVEDLRAAMQASMQEAMMKIMTKMMEQQMQEGGGAEGEDFEEPAEETP